MRLNNIPNGFHNFHGTVTCLDEIHVYKDSSWPEQLWRVRGWHGDYGLTNCIKDAIIIALSARRGQLYPTKIYVHAGGGMIIDKWGASYDSKGYKTYNTKRNNVQADSL